MHLQFIASTSSFNLWRELWRVISNNSNAPNYNNWYIISWSDDRGQLGANDQHLEDLMKQWGVAANYITNK